MRFLTPDLALDEDARWVVKDELVTVEFASEAGELQSAVGGNRYEVDDALLTGSTGDRWCVSRVRFDAKYRPVAPLGPGGSGLYRNLPIRIRARQIEQAFSVERSPGGDLLHGTAGDWLVQYAPAEHGIVAAARFAAVYRLVDAGG